MNLRGGKATKCGTARNRVYPRGHDLLTHPARTAPSPPHARICAKVRRRTQGNDDKPRRARDCCWLRTPTVVPLEPMDTSRHTGRTCAVHIDSLTPMALGAALLIAAPASGDELSGYVRAWGQYGNQLEMRVPADLGLCTQVATDFLHAIALRRDGMVRCWGRNDYGQCNTPVDIGACSFVSVGYQHSIAVRSNGEVWCWGGERIWAMHCSDKSWRLHSGGRWLHIYYRTADERATAILGI